jgi:hypothetical protein
MSDQLLHCSVGPNACDFSLQMMDLDLKAKFLAHPPAIHSLVKGKK